MSLLLSSFARDFRGFEAWILWTLLLKPALILQTLMVTLCTVIINSHKSCFLLTECIFVLCLVCSVPLQKFCKAWRLKINGTYELLIYANDVNVLDGSIRTIRRNTETSVVASQEYSVESNAKNNSVHCQVWKPEAIHLWKGGMIMMFGNKPNKSKLRSRRN
jgi:hypothetical protein